MIKTVRLISAAISLTLVLVMTAYAQQTSGNPQPVPDNYVTEKNFKSKVFDVKYRDPNSLASVLSRLTSGFKGASIAASTEFKTITVRDFPENLVTIEEAIRRLDTPMAPRPDIELHMYVLIASNNGGGVTDAPAELKDVLTELRGTLTYKNYDLAATVIQRLTDTSNLQGSGTADLPSVNAGGPSSPLPYEFYLRNVSLAQSSAGAPSIQIGEFSFSALGEHERAVIKTALNLRDGEKVVVGTAALRNRALAVVLTAKLVK